MTGGCNHTDTYTSDVGRHCGCGAAWFRATHDGCEIAAFVPEPATEPGALSGWVAVCSCGYRIKSSLRSIAWSDGAAHVRYMAERGQR